MNLLQKAFMFVCLFVYLFSLPGIHGDEISTSSVQFDILPFKHEHRSIGILSIFDGQNLLGNDRQNFKVYSVELVKAAPASRL